MLAGEGGLAVSKPTSRQMKEFWSQVDAGRITSANFQAFLDNPNVEVAKLAESTVWKTIALGTGPKSGKAYAKALKKAGCRVSDWALDMLNHDEFKVSEGMEIDLVFLSGYDLGFAVSATRVQIYEAGLAQGYELCPPEVGPALRLQYKDQSAGEWLFVAMESISDSEGYPAVFHVGYYGSELWLNSNYGNPDNVWNSNNRWVFVRPRKSLHSPIFLSGFSFYLLIHPPSIRPTSCNFFEISIYFLFPIMSISHKSCTKNFRESNFVFSTFSFSGVLSFGAYCASSAQARQSVNNASIFAPRVWRENFGRLIVYPCHTLYTSFNAIMRGVPKLRRGGAFIGMKIQLPHTRKDIICLENLLSAWQEFIIGKRKKRDVQEFSFNLMDNIVSLHEDLKNNTYRHGVYHSFFINDPKRRHIHKARVRDRLLHHAIHRLLYPFFDKTFISDSYSCRKNKGTHKAMNRFRSLTYKASQNHTRTCWVLKCDIKKFFASVDQSILLAILKNYIPDKNIISLLQDIITSFSTQDKPNSGLPLGNLTSQLFVNMYMNEFDQFIKHKLKIKHYIRYADDFVILSNSKQYLEHLIPQIIDTLMKKLKLTLHPNKLFFKTISFGVDFLGWIQFVDHRVLRKVTKRRMFANLKKDIRKEVLQSYRGLLGHGNGYKLEKIILDL
ncbi:MAG: reverse transcriptase domain-containing protein [Candidatus Magasanikbacteria bacterium]